MADPKKTSGESTEFFVECDERPGSLYDSLMKERFAPSARQCRMVISVKVLPKPGASASKKTAGS